MTFVQLRNHVISELTKYLGCTVKPSDKKDDVADLPYCYYSVLTPRTSNHYFGLKEVEQIGDEFIQKRSEPVEATMSFTFRSENHETDTEFILGEDEAQELAEKAHSFFLLHAHNISTDVGDIVVRNVGNVVNRTSFLVEDSVCRYGFDVRFAYVRTDEEPTTIIEVGNGSGEFQK